MTQFVPQLMGVVNVTPDSFSDGGLYTTVEAATNHARQLAEAGAQILDIGGESTRPGAERVGVAEEINRVVPVIEAIVSSHWYRQLGAEKPALSVDTMNAATAIAAVEAGAAYVNDVAGGLADPAMLAAVAATPAKYILGHWRGHSSQMDNLAVYQNVAADVASELADRVTAATEAGITRERILLDPGLGFAKDANQNWQILANLDPLVRLQLPLVIGASRKRFLVAALQADPTEVDNVRRDAATATLAALLVAGPYSANIAMLRVHNIGVNRDAIDIALALKPSRVAG